MSQSFNLFWFRRDLRLNDNAGLYYALLSVKPVLPLFVFDTEILDKLENRTDSRVQFIYQSLINLQQELSSTGSGLHVRTGKPLDVIDKLLTEYTIDEVFTNEDYESYGLQRDRDIKKMLEHKGILMHFFTDHLLFKPGEVLKPDNKPYTIFTPFAKKWKEKLVQKGISSFPSEKHLDRCKKEPTVLPSLESIGFQACEFSIFPPILNAEALIRYRQERDFPALDTGSRNGIHLRFGTISARLLVSRMLENETYLNELIWREFFMHILFHFPAAEKQCFYRRYEGLPWLNDELFFKRWCEGTTGYPLVDAGMRELNTTGFMHNRARMVVASFLTKHLLTDWRWGEAYFASKLLDFELSSNNGNWQWAAGTGCDAAPYFRVFNPSEQQKKFDPELTYCKRWIP